VVMGYKVRDEKPITIESKEWSWKPGMSTLYLVKQGTVLRKDHGRFVIEGGKLDSGSPPDPISPLEIPIQEVGRILVMGRVQLSTSAIEVCLNQQIPVIFMSQTGEYKGHLWSGEFCDLPTEAAQFGRRQDPTFQLELARQIVWGKGMNSKLTLQRFNRRRKADGVAAKIKRLEQHLMAVQQTTDLNQLRGYEGAIAKLYFAGLGQMITHSGFSLTGRNRRPPKDPVNSLLSFGYTLLFNNVMSLILAEGLNPYLGNLHRSDRKDPHLAFDLMEEFRAPIVDSLVIALINQKILRPTDFTYPNAEGGVYLEAGARRVFLREFEDRISETMTHPRTQQSMSYRRAIQLQVQQYKQCLHSSQPYQPFIRPTQ
jgi:CRISP-associated protein Cas1